VTRARFLCVVALAGCGVTASTKAVDAARERDEECLSARAADFDGPAFAGKYVVVQDGEVAATATLADDAAREAAKKDAGPPHRFVFRPSDRGATPAYRMAYLAEGGVVVGKKFLQTLGIESGRLLDAAEMRPVHLKLLVTPHVKIDVETLDGSARRTIDAVYDPDFDGSLLVPVAVASALSLQRFEIPGEADVQVALGRPFRARRALVIAKVAGIAASGAVEVEYEAPLKKSAE